LKTRLLEIGIVAVLVAIALNLWQTIGDVSIQARAEAEAFRTLERADATHERPDHLRETPTTDVWTDGSYNYASFRQTAGGVVRVRFEEGLAEGTPSLLYAWPVGYDRTARRAWVLRPPGFVLQSENDADSVEGAAGRTGPWSPITRLEAPWEPESGAPPEWSYADPDRQARRLEPRGITVVQEEDAKK